MPGSMSSCCSLIYQRGHCVVTPIDLQSGATWPVRVARKALPAIKLLVADGSGSNCPERMGRGGLPPLETCRPRRHRVHHYRPLSCLGRILIMQVFGPRPCSGVHVRASDYKEAHSSRASIWILGGNQGGGLPRRPPRASRQPSREFANRAQARLRR